MCIKMVILERLLIFECGVIQSYIILVDKNKILIFQVLALIIFTPLFHSLQKFFKVIRFSCTYNCIMTLKDTDSTIVIIVTYNCF